MYYAIDVLKTIAALLITNSHFDTLYPIGVLSIGGSLGNTIFFIVSGFCLSNAVQGGYLQWCYSRAKRIYLPFWILTLLLAVLGYEKLTKVNFIQQILFPYNTAWFICAILIYYAIFWFIVRVDEKYFKYVGIFIIVVYFSMYFTLDLSVWSVESKGFFKYIFYFGAMFVGYILKKKIVQIDKLYDKTMLFGAATSVFLILYLGLKVLTNKFVIVMHFQFLVQLMTLLFAVSFFLFVFSMEKNISLYKYTYLGRVLTFTSKATLEIYLLNAFGISIAGHVIFPINILVALLIILVSGILSNKVIAQLSK